MSPSSLKLLLLLGLVAVAFAQDYDGDDDEGGFGDFFGGDDGGDDDFAAASGIQQQTQEAGDFGGSMGEGGPLSSALFGAASDNKPVKVAFIPDQQFEQRRKRRSIEPQASQVLKRVRRGKGVTGPIYTYIKTDYHGNFKWGARHNVGKHFRGKRSIDPSSMELGLEMGIPLPLLPAPTSSVQ